MSARLVSVIGPPGSGKTTTAEWLAEALPGRLVREDYAGNPFLSDSYLGRRDFALPAQLYFLFSRLGQLNRSTWPAEGSVVTDYGFCQDAVYAAINLAGDDLALYRRLAAHAGGMVQPPDLLIHLDGPEDLLLARVARRGRPHEKSFTAAFLASMRRAYQRIAARAEAVLPVDVGRTNLLEAPAQADMLAEVRRRLSC